MLSKLVSAELDKISQFKKRVQQIMLEVPLDDPLFPAAPGIWSIYSISDPGWVGTVSGEGAVNVFTPLALRELVRILAAHYDLHVPRDLQISYQLK